MVKNVNTDFRHSRETQKYMLENGWARRSSSKVGTHDAWLEKRTKHTTEHQSEERNIGEEGKGRKSGFRAQQHLNATFSYFMRITKIVCIAISVKQDRDWNYPQ